MTARMTQREFLERYRALRALTIDEFHVASLAEDAGVEWLPERTRIKRGDVIETPKDVAGFEVPNETAFRDPAGLVHVYHVRQTDAIRTWPGAFPLRCIDVPNTDGKCPTCTGSHRETAGMVCETCWTDYGVPGDPAPEQRHDVNIETTVMLDSFMATCACGWVSQIYPTETAARAVAEGHQAALS